ncbi:coiled-coil domain-containing protein 74A [Megalops cyprinoides]|uniref:coiled-coil domain-containing protein 74A n=1 Tax=Megalops cyprinoides TaxID=118141 RepID=UPI001864884B|nr:coiled-coil domain-containing protein 74A [Megalops cyprinoides]
MDTRVASLERDIQFLQRQHKDTLEKLHRELDELKRENKELHYKMIMDPPQTHRKGSGSCRRCNRPLPQTETQAQRGGHPERARSASPLSQGTPLSCGTEHSEAPPKHYTDMAPPRPAPPPPADMEPRGGLITSLQPLRIHSGPSRPPRAPTLQECEVIIRQLYNANSLQSQEIQRVKAVLRDIVFSKKITPETYIMTKAYLADGTRTEEAERFPKLPLKPLQQRLVGSQVGVAERVVLPALKQSVGSSVAERQRRTQAVQRGRLRRTVH